MDSLLVALKLHAEDAPDMDNLKILALVADGKEQTTPPTRTSRKQSVYSPTSVTLVPEAKDMVRCKSLDSQISLSDQRSCGPLLGSVSLKDGTAISKLGGNMLPSAKTCTSATKTKTVAGSKRSCSRTVSRPFKKRLFIKPVGTLALMDDKPAKTAEINNASSTTLPSATTISESMVMAGFKPSSSSHAISFTHRNSNPLHGDVLLKDEGRPAIATTPKSNAPPTTFLSTPSTPQNIMVGCKSSNQPFLARKKASTVSKPMLYVGIALERPETLNSWGLVFTKENSNHALIARVVPPSTVKGPSIAVKWCQITNSAPSPSVVYRTTTTSAMPPDTYEAFVAQNFPPYCEEKRPRNTGLLVPYINPGDAIIAINGIPVSAFTTMGDFASYIGNNCQRKMLIVALRHEDVWNAALGQMLPPPGGQEHQKGHGGARDSQATTDRVAKAVNEAWKGVLVSRGVNHQVKRKATFNPVAKKRPKIYVPVYKNSDFRDANRNPIPYCDNNDYDPEDGKRIHSFVNDEIEKSFDQWLRKRKTTWGENRPKNVVSHTVEDANDGEFEELTVGNEFWLANGYESFDQWLSTSKSKWTRSYSWHKEKREALQSECEKEVHLPMITTTVESPALLNRFGNWLSARKQQWRLERRKRQRHRVGIPASATEDGNACLPTGASGDVVANDIYFDEMLEDEEERLTNKEGETCQPMDISWVFDSQHGAPDDVVVNIMTYLLPSDHGNLLCLSFGTNFLFKQREDMWKALCPGHWILPRRPRKSWCVMYITKIRAEEEASRKRSDDLLVKANVVIEKGDQLNKLEKIVRKGEKDFELSVNYTSGVVLERNSLLNLAVIHKRHKIVKWLVEDKGADIESCDRGQFTPLVNAAWNGDKHIVRYLLGKGCDRNKVGYNHSSQGLASPTFGGLCAEGWARKRGHDAVAELIRLGL